MPLHFTKMHGLGNDYVYVSLFDQRVEDAPALARRMSDRHRGVGADGLILIAPPEDPAAHVRMIMYNADGSRSEMCGNGIRCVAKLAYERGWARHNPLRVQTDRGVLVLELMLDDRGRVQLVRVDMGEPILRPAEIPVRLAAGQGTAVVPFSEHVTATGDPLVAAGDRVVASPFVIGGAGSAGENDSPVSLPLTCVSMGNPHAVFFVPDVAAVPLATWGPRVEHHPLFPKRVNVHFVQVLSPDRVRMITWERGTGPTQACGTGASAVCVAGVLNRLTQRAITAELPGGELRLEWNAETNHVFKTGPAVEVFTGDWPA